MGDILVIDFNKKRLFSKHSENNMNITSDTLNDVDKLEMLKEITGLKKPKWINQVDIGHILYNPITRQQMAVIRYDRVLAVFFAVDTKELNNPMPTQYKLNWNINYEIKDVLPNLKIKHFHLSFEKYDMEIKKQLKLK